MKLQKFRKNQKQKRIVIGSIVGILLLIGGISLYRSFAMYEEKKTFDVLNGTVPEFVSGDLQLTITVDGKKEDNIPTKDNNYGVVVSCDNATGSWDKENWQAVLGNFNGSKVKCNLYFESTLSGYIKALAKIEESIIEEEHEETDQTPKQVDYRYVGKEPNNYVCLEDSGTCTEDQLYRIIGVIPTQKEENGEYEDRVKLIKNTSYGQYSWGNENDPFNGEWSKMKLNTDTLNKTYWNSISSYQQYIENAKWYLAKTTTWQTTPLRHYRDERASKMLYDDYSTFIVTNIGLINGSDYFFATSGGSTIKRKQCLETYQWNEGNNVDCKNNSWLYDDEKAYWAINLGAKDSTQYDAMQLDYYGIVGNCNILLLRDVKPTFYLKATVLYKSGDGSKEKPYLISLNNS